MPDKRDRDEMIKKSQQVKDDVLKHYQDELAATTTAGLLDSPAIIAAYIFNVSPTTPIFTTEAAGGKMLVTENPAYMRKDLPKYIPQLIVLKWDMYSSWWFTPLKDPSKEIDENFPIEKLQAMIDK